MKTLARWKVLAFLSSGMILGILPSCVEEKILQFAVPFLLSQA